VETLVRLGVERFIELGPGTTLTAMGKRIDSEMSWTSVASPMALSQVAQG
jgi:malonyl CoA-acyl carrier protein transacylase